MKKSINLILKGQLFFIFFSVCHLASAQHPLKIYSGGYGHFSGGVAFVNSAFANDLVIPENANQELPDLGSTGFIYGGEGFGIKNRFFFGGGGFALYLPAVNANEISLNFGMGGGYFKAGYLIQQKSRGFSYFFGSIGGGEMTVTIKNRSQKEISLKDGTFVPPFTTNRYKSGIVLFDAGLGTKFIVTPVTNSTTRCGGLVLGVDVGCKISTPVGDWELKHNEVYLSDRPTQVMPYIRLTFGGGSFNRK